MGAAVAKLGSSALSAIIGGGIGSRARGVDTATATVRLGRFAYVAGLGYIAVTWYFGWRNERVEGGTGEFPIPYLYKGEKIRDGAPDIDAEGNDSLIAAVPGLGNAAPIPGASALVPGLGDASGTARLAPGVAGNNTLLVRIGHTGQTAFKMRVYEHPSFGGVSPVHVRGSMHYQNRAFDAQAATGPLTAAGLRQTAIFAHWIAQNYLPQITQLIWNGPNPIFIYHGKIVSAQVYREVLETHKTHAHVGI